MFLVPSSSFQRVTALSLVEECHRQIKAKVLSGDLRPGDPVKDSVLAQAMGVSRSPVREALRQLEQSGLVVKSTNRSYRVASVGAMDAAELAALRSADEGLALRTIVRNRTSIEPLLPFLDAIRDAPAGTPQVVVADTDFHAALVALAGFPRLQARYANLTDHIRLVLVATGGQRRLDAETAWAVHLELYDALNDAIANGDASVVLPLWEEHVSHSLNTLSSIASG